MSHVQDGLALLGRLTFPLSMFAYPFYLLNRSPGKQGSHYDPKTDLFSDIEGPMVRPRLLHRYMPWQGRPWLGTAAFVLHQPVCPMARG